MRARLCPENGATIKVVQTHPNSRKEVIPVDDSTAFPEGLIFFALTTNDPITFKNTVIELPEGTTAEIRSEDNQLIGVVEVHRNGSKPMIHVPGEKHSQSGKPLYHHVDGEGYFGSRKLPNGLNPSVAIWCYNPSQQE